MGIEGIQNEKDDASKKQSRLMLAFVAIIVMGTALYLASTTELGSRYLTPNSVIASVNGREITQHEFNDSFSKAMIIYESEGADLSNKDVLLEYREKFLEEMINNLLLLQASENIGANASEYEILKEYNDLVTMLKGKEEFAAYMEANKLTEEEVKKNISDQIKIQKYLIDATDIEVVVASEDEILATYDKVVASVEDAPPLDKVRSLIESELIRQKVVVLVADHIEMLRKDAEIEKNL